jgi:peptide/nickel transport system permease protein
LLIGLVSTAVALAVGVPLGALAGYFGGLVDDALMRFTEIFQTIPSFALAIVIVAILQPSITSIVWRSRSSAGRRSRGWCAARCCRCARANMFRRPWSSADDSAHHIHQVLPNAVAPIIVIAR